MKKIFGLALLMFFVSCTTGFKSLSILGNIKGTCLVYSGETLILSEKISPEHFIGIYKTDSMKINYSKPLEIIIRANNDCIELYRIKKKVRKKKYLYLDMQGANFEIWSTNKEYILD